LGERPAAGLIRDKEGNLNGTTVGTANLGPPPHYYGTVFKLDPSGERNSAAYLHRRGRRRESLRGAGRRRARQSLRHDVYRGIVQLRNGVQDRPERQPDNVAQLHREGPRILPVYGITTGWTEPVRSRLRRRRLQLRHDFPAHPASRGRIKARARRPDSGRRAFLSPRKFSYVEPLKRVRSTRRKHRRSFSPERLES
jgi:hypothetical protein